MNFKNSTLDNANVRKQVEQLEITHTADINWYNYYTLENGLTLFVITKDKRKLDNLHVPQ